MTIKTELINVTPEMAKKWLAQSGGNRRINPLRVEQYCRDMQAGRWVVAETLKFDEDDVFFDGHHRLSAVIHHGLPVPFLVTTGLPKNSIHGVDLGQTRTLQQISIYTGECFSGQHFAVARIIEYGYSPSGRPAGTGLSYNELRDLVLKYESGINFAVKHGSGRKYCSASIMAVIARASYHLSDPERLREFFPCLESGLAKDNGDWGAIRLRIFMEDAINRGHSLNPFEVYQRGETAVSAFYKKSPLRALKPSTKEMFPLKLNSDGRVVPE